MRIIELITFLGSGGAERFLVDLSNQLSKENDVFIVTILDDQKDSEVRNFYRSEIREKVKYINLGIPNGLKVSSQWKVYNELKKLKPDIIHIHMIPTLKYSALAIGLLSLTNKVYFSVHNDLHNGYDKGIFKLYCNTLGRLNRFKLSCLSEKNYLDFKSFYRHTPIKCIPNGRAPLIPTQLLNSVKEELNNLKHNQSSKILIHIARCHPVKNQRLLIQAVNELADEDHNIDLIIIGAGFDSLEGKEILAQACSRIHYIGVRKNIADYMLNSDILCLSSDYEGMPITLLEACLAGVPAVSTPVCGAVDLIENGKNGYLSKSHSVEDYKNAVVKALDNYNIIKSNANKRKNDSPYTIKECARKYIEYFQ